MPCFHPRDMYSDGAGGFSMVERPPYTFKKIQFRCGRCDGCRADRRDEWSMRVMDEARSAGLSNCAFLTLTFDDNHLPYPPQVSEADIRQFIKRLRNRFRGTKIRYFSCGEYGDRGNRPHYHLIIFGYNFPDRKYYAKNAKGDRRYKSAILESLWPYGLCEVGDVTERSAGYVASYLVKGGGKGPLWIDPETLEGVELTKPFQAMSTHPGIGMRWFSMFTSDVLPRDYKVVDGVERKVPRYYEKLFKRGSRENRDVLDQIKAERELKSARRAADNTDARLAVKEVIAQQRRKRWKDGML